MMSRKITDPDYITTDVNMEEVKEAYDLITREINCKSAFQSVCNFLKLSDVQLKGGSTYRQQWFEDNILRKFQEILMWFYICGFCPYVIDTVWVDTARDKEWLSNFKTTFDKQNEKYRVKLPTVNIPDPESIIVRILTNRKTLVSHLVCERASDRFNTKVNKMGVFQSRGKFRTPRMADGLLQSPIASLFYSFRKLRKYEAYALQASYSLAYPVTFVQNEDVDKNDNIQKTTNAILTMEGEINPNNPKYKDKRYMVIDARRRAQHQLTEAYRANANQKLGTTQQYFNDSLTKRGFTQQLVNTSDVLYPIGDGLQLSKANPVSAKPPDGMEEIRMSWPLDVAKAFDIPHIVVSNTKISGGGHNKSYADIELKTLNATINQLTAEMKHLFKEMESVLQMGEGDKKMKFEIHPQPFHDPEFIMGLWESQRLTEWQMDKILEDSFGIEPDPEKKPSHSTASMEHILAMKKNDEGIGTQTIKKQMRLLHNADI